MISVVVNFGLFGSGSSFGSSSGSGSGSGSGSRISTSSMSIPGEASWSALLTSIGEDGAGEAFLLAVFEVPAFFLLFFFPAAAQDKHDAMTPNKVSMIW